mgnify:FL=1
METTLPQEGNQASNLPRHPDSGHRPYSEDNDDEEDDDDNDQDKDNDKGNSSFAYNTSTKQHASRA